MFYLENETQHTLMYGRRLFRVVSGALEYAYMSELRAGRDHARWYGFSASIPCYTELDSIDTALAIAK